MSWLTDPAQRILYGAIDGLSRREELIATNVANIDTPGYRAMVVDFESTLRQQVEATFGGALPQGGSAAGGDAPQTGHAVTQGRLGLATTDPRHFRTGPAIGTGGGAAQSINETIRNDGNTVDLEAQMTALTNAQLQYGAVSRLITTKLGMLRDAIGGR